MQAKRPDPNASFESLFPSRFLRAYHLIDNGMTEIADTIKDVLLETVEPRPGNPEEKPVLYFEKIRTPYLLSAKADADTLREVYQVATVGDLIGLRVTIHVSDWRGKAVLRVKPVPPPPLTQPELNPEIEEEHES